MHDSSSPISCQACQEMRLKISNQFEFNNNFCKRKERVRRVEKIFTKRKYEKIHFPIGFDVISDCCWKSSASQQDLFECIQYTCCNPPSYEWTHDTRKSATRERDFWIFLAYSSSVACMQKYPTLDWTGVGVRCLALTFLHAWIELTPSIPSNQVHSTERSVVLSQPLLTPNVCMWNLSSLNDTLDAPLLLRWCEYIRVLIGI